MSHASINTPPSEQHSRRISHVWGNKRVKEKSTNSRRDTVVRATSPRVFTYARVLKTVEVFNLGFPSKKWRWMNVGRVGLYESGLKQGLIPLLFLQKDKTGKGRGATGNVFPQQIHWTRPFAATRLSPQSPTLLFKRTQTVAKWEANSERKGDIKRERVEKRRDSK